MCFFTRLFVVGNGMRSMDSQFADSLLPSHLADRDHARGASAAARSLGGILALVEWRREVLLWTCIVELSLTTAGLALSRVRSASGRKGSECLLADST